MEGCAGEVIVVLAAGFATAPRFMEPLERSLTALGDRYPIAGVVYAFPYGDWGRSRWRQLRELRYDVYAERGRRFRPIGGGRLAETLRREGAEGPLLLIGHSGGGVAAVHAAQLLLAGGFEHPLRIVMIGSPRCRVPDRLRPSVLYLRGVDAARNRTDPICRLGSWGGWERTAGIPGLRWNRHRYAPGEIVDLKLIGSHADYFRELPPYVNESGLSNLEQVVSAIRRWLERESDRAGGTST